MSGKASEAGAHEASTSTPLEDALLGKPLLDLALQIRSGRTLPLVTQSPWSKIRAQAIHDKVVQCLRTGDLAALLQTIPDALAHPLVSHWIARLRRLAECAEEAQIQGEAQIDDEVVDAEICGVAKAALLRVANALACGLLRDAEWTLKRTRRRGRPKRSWGDLYEAHYVSAEYDSVLEDLKAHRSEYRRNRGESETVWLVRLKDGIRRAWAASSMSLHVESTPSSVSVSDNPLDLFDRALVFSQKPLPDSVVRQCARKVVEMAGEGRPVLDHIAYTLVGHARGVAPDSIRHQVQVARQASRK
jgi:hypothetical protein